MSKDEQNKAEIDHMSFIMRKPFIEFSTRFSRLDFNLPTEVAEVFQKIEILDVKARASTMNVYYLSSDNQGNSRNPNCVSCKNKKILHPRDIRLNF